MKSEDFTALVLQKEKSLLFEIDFEEDADSEYLLFDYVEVLMGWTQYFRGLGY